MAIAVLTAISGCDPTALNDRSSCDDWLEASEEERTTYAETREDLVAEAEASDVTVTEYIHSVCSQKGAHGLSAESTLTLEAIH